MGGICTEAWRASIGRFNAASHNNYTGLTAASAERVPGPAVRGAASADRTVMLVVKLIVSSLLLRCGDVELNPGPPPASAGPAPAKDSGHPAKFEPNPRSKKEQGYAYGLLVNVRDREMVLNNDYMCGHCQLVPRDPLQTSCGHRLCVACYDYLMGIGDETQCPDCARLQQGTAISSVKTFRDRALERTLMKLDVKCLNVPCNWTGKLGDLDVHEDECWFGSVTCEKCGAGMERNQLEAHKQSGECETKVKGCNPSEDQLTELPEHVGETAGRLDHLLRVLQEHQKELTKVGEHSREDNSEIRSQVSSLKEDMHKEVTSIADRLSAMERHIEAAPRTRSTMSGQAARRDGAATHTEVNLSTVHDELKILSDAVYVMFRDFNKKIERLEQVEEERVRQTSGIDARVTEVEQRTLKTTVEIKELCLRADALEHVTRNGKLMWKISDVNRKWEEARGGLCSSIYSPPFYSSDAGYKMCMRAYLNGDGLGKGTHMSLFFVLMKGEYDALLQWPFRMKITMTLLNQTVGTPHRDAFRPDVTSTSFSRPVTAMNVASGSPMFISHPQLTNPENSYLVDDTLFIQVEVSLLS